MHNLTVRKVSMAPGNIHLSADERWLTNSALEALLVRVSDAFADIIREVVFTYEVDETNHTVLVFELEALVPDVGPMRLRTQQAVIASPYMAKVVAQVAIANMHECLTRFAQARPQHRQALIRARQGLRRWAEDEH